MRMQGKRKKIIYKRKIFSFVGSYGDLWFV